MVAWTYADFPVTPDSQPMAGNGDVVLADQARELREAILRRASLIGAIASPPDVADLEVCYFSWLTGMRSAIEALVSAGEFLGEPMIPWTKATLLTHIHGPQLGRPLLTDPAEWMEAADADYALDGHANTRGNPVFHESGDTEDAISDYDFPFLASGTYLDDDLKFYVSIIDEGSDTFRIRLYSNAARTYETIRTDPFPGDIAESAPVKLPIFSQYGLPLPGGVTIDGEITAANAGIEVLVEYDPSIMYSAHINELYLALERLCYIEMPCGSVVGLASESAYGMGYGPGPAWDPYSMELAYTSGWDDFYATGYGPGGVYPAAEATSHLAQDEWSGEHFYGVSDSRVLDAQTTVPTALFDIFELAVPFWSTAADSGGYHAPDTFGCLLDGSYELGRFGELGGDYDIMYFSGWVAWAGLWNGDVVSLAFQWSDIDIGYWGGAYPHDDYLALEPASYMPLICGFAFDDVDGQYRNFDWSPIASWEWGITWPW